MLREAYGVKARASTRNSRSRWTLKVRVWEVDLAMLAAEAPALPRSSDELAERRCEPSG